MDLDKSEKERRKHIMEKAVVSIVKYLEKQGYEPEEEVASWVSSQESRERSDETSSSEYSETEVETEEEEELEGEDEVEKTGYYSWKYISCVEKFVEPIFSFEPHVGKTPEPTIFHPGVQLMLTIRARKLPPSTDHLKFRVFLIERGSNCIIQHKENSVLIGIDSAVMNVDQKTLSGSVNLSVSIHPEIPPTNDIARLHIEVIHMGKKVGVCESDDFMVCREEDIGKKEIKKVSSEELKKLKEERDEKLFEDAWNNKIIPVRSENELSFRDLDWFTGSDEKNGGAVAAKYYEYEKARRNDQLERMKVEIMQEYRREMASLRRDMSNQIATLNRRILRLEYHTGLRKRRKKKKKLWTHGRKKKGGDEK